MTKLSLDTNHDAEMRLNNSVVSYNWQPVLVTEAGVRYCNVVNTITREEERVKTQDLCLFPVSVGNVHIGNKYYYCERAPKRRYKQGLTGDNLVCYEMPWGEQFISFKSKEVGNAIINSFPSLDDCLAITAGESRAFSKTLGIYRDRDGGTYLMYKDKQIGMFEKDELTIFKKYFFCKEFIMEVLNAI